MANLFAPAEGWRITYVITGATPIHQITTVEEQVANQTAAELRAAGFLVTIDRIIDVELVAPKLLTNHVDKQEGDAEVRP